MNSRPPRKKIRPTDRKKCTLGKNKGRLPDKHFLNILLMKHGVKCSPVEINLLWKFHNLLRQGNTDSDLSRLHAFDTIVERHYADSLLVKRYIKSWPKRMLDIGTGAGFPGIPLKIIRPSVHFTLCEPRKRRAEYLQQTVDALGLKRVKVFPHKVTSASMELPVDGIITRAFESMEKTLLRVENSLEPRGRAFFMKGPSVDQELDTFNMPGYRIERVHRYTIPNSTQERSLVVVRRGG